MLGRGRICPQGGTLRGDGVASAYMASEFATAAPGRLALMVYDGAVRMCRQALVALDDGDVELAADRLAKATTSLCQLRGSLEGSAARLGTGKFRQLCDKVQRRLVEADYYRRRESVAETITLLDSSRLAWSEFAQTLDDTLEVSAKGWVG